MGIFGNLFSPLFEEAGSALGGLIGSVAGDKGREIGAKIGRGGGGLVGGLLPFKKGGVVAKGKKGKKPAHMVKGSVAAKRHMAKLRKMKK
jgi:hypothetical protein